jgi:hypothetical protein
MKSRIFTTEHPFPFSQKKKKRTLCSATGQQYATEQNTPFMMGKAQI